MSNIRSVLSPTVVITGAFSYTGKYTTRLLLQRGYRVRTLTSHPERRNGFDGAVEVFPFNFEDSAELERSLCGASTLINTYWVRFSKGGSTFESAVQNTVTLFAAARKAGIKRIVHVSIANPAMNSALGYYRGKAVLEDALSKLQIPYSIVRPTVIYGREDILINNIAWFLRNFPAFAIPGDGKYGVRPIYVEDMASLLAGAVESQHNEILDAVGPETFAFDDLVTTIAVAIGRSPKLVHVPAWFAHAGTRIVGWFVGDVVLTKQEYTGLMEGLLAPDGPSTGRTLLTDWLTTHGNTLGLSYASETARHFR